MVGFDDSNMRLGYGQGNYDEFLVQCSPNASIIGVAFKEQHVACVYPEPHDVALPDIIVS
ncbi:5-formyltetrahydrofolate cyclo-ligase [Chlamydia trachomatis]|nr:5-formyltetrahydrofolate cyclo-ligase [Chlamydia trachomatis]